MQEYSSRHRFEKADISAKCPSVPQCSHCATIPCAFVELGAFNDAPRSNDEGPFTFHSALESGAEAYRRVVEKGNIDRAQHRWPRERPRD